MLPGRYLIGVTGIKEVKAYFSWLNWDIQFCEIVSLQQPGQNGEGLAEILQDTLEQRAKMWNMPKCLQWQ